ncbi:MAG: hypothetical protein GF418_10800 [Chitinivibrionales bacterium]|nr:hypothetical protein [Chitinivibrionales bacterium]MBD3396103.1 hypothetical protein [Chitinivibrionales bacterium]
MKLAAALFYISLLTILFCLSVKGVIAAPSAETVSPAHARASPRCLNDMHAATLLPLSTEVF